MGLFDNIRAGMKGFGQGVQSNINENRATGEPYSDHRGSFDASGARIEGSDRPSFWDKMKHNLTDDQGLFQGGEQGRIGGRYLDIADKVNAGDSGFNLPGGANPNQTRDNVTTVSNAQGEETTVYSNPMDELDSALKTFDPDNPESVLAIQKLLNSAQITDNQGNMLKEDSKLGDLTMSAIDRFRSGESEEIQNPDGSYVDRDAFGFGTNGENTNGISLDDRKIFSDQVNNAIIDSQHASADASYANPDNSNLMKMPWEEDYPGNIASNGSSYTGGGNSLERNYVE